MYHGLDVRSPANGFRRRTILFKRTTLTLGGKINEPLPQNKPAGLKKVSPHSEFSAINARLFLSFISLI
jgi:hypothetical protein